MKKTINAVESFVKKIPLSLIYAVIFILLFFLGFVFLYDLSVFFALFALILMFLMIISLSMIKKTLTSFILLIAFLIFVFSAPFTYGIAYYVKHSILPSGMNLVPIGEVDSWITFSGSIIGGITVMIALAFTIHYETKKRNEDMNNLLLPYVDVFIRDLAHPKNQTKELYNVGMSLYSDAKYSINIHNISNNMARRLEILNARMHFYTDNSMRNNLGSIELSVHNPYVEFLPSDGIFSPILDTGNVNILNDVNYITIQLIISFYDVSNLNQHFHEVKFHFELDLYFSLRHTENTFIK